MTGWGRVFRYAAAAVGVTALLGGCGGGGDGTAAGQSTVSATPTIAPDAPTAFNGCQLPQSVVDAEQFDPNPDSADAIGNGRVRWRGCTWSTHEGDGYGVGIRTTNITIPMIQANNQFTIAETLTIDGRQAVTYHQTGQTDLRRSCLLEVEMKDGGLEISVTNDPDRKATGSQASCDIAKRLGGELAPTFSASA